MEGDVFISQKCKHCKWKSIEFLDSDEYKAKNAVTLHIIDSHPRVYSDIVGSEAPKLDEYYKLLLLEYTEPVTDGRND